MKHPTSKLYMLKMVYNIKSWIAYYAEELHDHTVLRCFKCTLNEDEKPAMYYRNWIHEQWKEPIVIPEVHNKLFYELVFFISHG